MPSISVLLFARYGKCADGGKNAVALSAKKVVNLSHSRFENTFTNSVSVAATCTESVFVPVAWAVTEHGCRHASKKGMHAVKICFIMVLGYALGLLWNNTGRYTAIYT